MNDLYLIELFCFIDDALNSLGIKDDPRARFSEAEVVFVGILAARLFSGNIRNASSYLKSSGYCPKMLSESRLNRRLHKVDYWNNILSFLSKADSQYIVDSFPIPSCRLSRLSTARLFKGKCFKGYNSSHKTFFHGLKIHLIIEKNGCLHLFQITPGSEHDLKALKFMDLSFPRPCRLYADKAYNDYKFEDKLLKEKIRLTPQRKENSLKSYTKGIALKLKKYRKRVETAISGIVRLMPRWIQAVTEHGFEMKICLFILVYASNFLN